jgi:hypothetical protein
MYIYIYIYIYMHACMYVSKCMYMCVYVCMYVVTTVDMVMLLKNFGQYVLSTSSLTDNLQATCKRCVIRLP